jgi:hypothetical protein
MEHKAQDTKPVARKKDLLTQEIPGELLVYDTQRDSGHCLNDTAAFVWQHCDGHHTPQNITALLKKKDSAVDEEIVWLALNQLADKHLLERRLSPPPTLTGISRRRMARALGLAAVVAVPLISSIVAPTAVEASTCRAAGQPCASGVQCCSLVCNGSNLCT